MDNSISGITQLFALKHLEDYIDECYNRPCTKSENQKKGWDKNKLTSTQTTKRLWPGMMNLFLQTPLQQIL